MDPGVRRDDDFEPDAATSRVLAAGDRGQAKHGCFARESGQGEYGPLARHAAQACERPARCAGPDRGAGLTERTAIPGRQGAASFRRRN